jgi:predicted component of type VI protein secretion system
MLLKFQRQDGSPGEIELGDDPITMGRSPDADVPILDERASRTHCGIRLWDGEYYVKDLKSKNGTYINNEKVEMSRIKPGDKIRIGHFVIEVADESKPGTDTLMGEVAGAMDEGKGFKTMLREIVEDVEESEQADKVARQKDVIPPEAAAKQTVIKKKVSTVVEEPEDAAPPPPLPEASSEPGPSTPPPPAPQAPAPEAEAVDPDKPKTIRLKQKPKRPVQIKINKRPSE